jgi:ketosteroid isomerase-like protein
MSEESPTPDVFELTRRYIEATNRHDVDAVMSLVAADAVWDMSRRGLGVFEGSEAIRGHLEGFWVTFEDHSVDLEQMLVLGTGVVFAVARQRARSVGVGAHVELREALVADVSPDGLWVRLTMYPDIDEARAAAERLSEERG